MSNILEERWTDPVDVDIGKLQEYCILEIQQDSVFHIAKMTPHISTFLQEFECISPFLLPPLSEIVAYLEIFPLNPLNDSTDLVLRH